MPILVKDFLRKNLANLITLGRVPLCFGSFACAVAVLHGTEYDNWLGFAGVWLLILTSLTDYFDGWVARKFQIITKLGPIADQMLDKMVYCIIFPTIAVGVMKVDGQGQGQGDIYHVTLSLILCVTMLVRDHYVSFLRTVASRNEGDTSVHEIGKLRTLLALPTSCVLYGYCFCSGEYGDIGGLNSIFVWVKNIDVKYLIVLELLLVIINIVSAISYTRTYGKYLMEEICEDDDQLRRKILSVFPNSLTLMNAVMGIIAAILAWNQKFHLAFVMLMMAAVFDKLDGAAARKLGLAVQEPSSDNYQQRFTLGAILDDIADAISFCIAPVFIAAAFMQDSPLVWWLAIYSVAGISRLIIFTLDKNPIPGFFKGLPSPAAALFVGGVVQAAAYLELSGDLINRIIFITFLAIGFLMNAIFVPYVHFGKLMSKSKLLSQFVFLSLLVAVFSPWLGLFAIGVMAIYLLSPFFVRTPKANPA